MNRLKSWCSGGGRLHRVLPDREANGTSSYHTLLYSSGGAAMRYCYRCGERIPEDRKILREEECPHCAQDLHCCRNCRFHDPAVSNQCSEPQADYVGDKERSNFCEFFAFTESAASRGGPGSEGESARERWRRLFKEG
ncbi:MAG TPA: hypothetical protein VFT43_01290 [Candidatus Polarisedimenticolia bacterium]|nr:hypothetical protein [Candidatus Polarisedimenticolia bacterium]